MTAKQIRLAESMNELQAAFHTLLEVLISVKINEKCTMEEYDAISQLTGAISAEARVMAFAANNDVTVVEEVKE